MIPIPNRICPYCGQDMLVYAISKVGDRDFEPTGPQYFAEHGCRGDYEPAERAVFSPIGTYRP